MKKFKENFKKCMNNFHYIAMAGVYMSIAVFGAACLVAGVAR